MGETVENYGWNAAANAWVKLAATAAGLVRVDMSAINLNDLADVNAPAPADNEALTFDLASGLWIPELAEPAIHGIAKHADVARTHFVPCGNFFTGIAGAHGRHDAIRLNTALDRHVHFEFRIPSDLVTATSLKVVWSGDAGVAGQDWVADGVAGWGCALESITAHASNPAAVAVDVTTLAETYESDIGFAVGLMYKNDYIGVQIYRRGTDVLDTYAGTVCLRGLLLSYTAEQ